MKTSRFLLAALSVVVPLVAHASPPGARLLPMVPVEAQIVAGLRIPHSTQPLRQISLVTHNNNVDFADWRAMVSTDPRAKANDVVEVAANSPRGQLAERLLLVDGNFDRIRIYRAARRNGAAPAEYARVQVVILVPADPGQQGSVGIRWLAIPDDTTALFGTPLLVQQALDRRAAHAAINADLAARVAHLRTAVDGWNAIEMPADLIARHLRNGPYGLAWLQARTHSDALLLGIRYGAETRIDFVAHSPQEASRLLAASETHSTSAELDRPPNLRIEQFHPAEHTMSGTLALPPMEGEVAFADSSFGR